MPLTTSTYVASDYVVTLLETVTDYRNNTRTVERAGRAQELRGLAAFFRGVGVRTLEQMRGWARTSTYRDFVGKVKGLGPTVYQWLVMRLGVETVKPDVHILRFVRDAIGRPVTEAEAVSALEQVAGRLGVRANLLDWRLWEHQWRGG